MTQLSQLINKLCHEVHTLQVNINNVQYIWALSRDQTIYNPKTAWRISEFAIHSENRLLV